MMLYEKNKDRKKFFRKVAKAIGQGEDDEDLENTEKQLGGDFDIDEVLPPSSGHQVGERVPTNTSRNTPRTGNFIEDLEDKLCKILLEKLGKPAPSPTSSPVGVQGRVENLGNSNPNVKPNTGAGKRRDEDNKYQVSRYGKKKADEDEEQEEQEDVVDQIAAEIGINEA